MQQIVTYDLGAWTEWGRCPWQHKQRSSLGVNTCLCVCVCVYTGHVSIFIFVRCHESLLCLFISVAAGLCSLRFYQRRFCFTQWAVDGDGLQGSEV